MADNESDNGCNARSSGELLHTRTDRENVAPNDAHEDVLGCYGFAFVGHAALDIRIYKRTRCLPFPFFSPLGIDLLSEFHEFRVHPTENLLSLGRQRILMKFAAQVSQTFYVVAAIQWKTAHANQ